MEDNKISEAALMKHIKSLLLENQYDDALKCLEDIDVSKVKNISFLCLTAEVYMGLGRYDEAEQILLPIYEKNPNTRRLLDLLTSLYIDKAEYSEAEYYYKEFISVASKDLHRYILRYRLDKGKGERLAVLIDTLEKLKDYEYIEEWAYELATLYEASGENEKCIRECDEILLWFGHGEYVDKAIRLKCKLTGEPLPEDLQYEDNDIEKKDEQEKLPEEDGEHSEMKDESNAYADDAEAHAAAEFILAEEPEVAYDEVTGQGDSFDEKIALTEDEDFPKHENVDEEAVDETVIQKKPEHLSEEDAAAQSIGIDDIYADLPDGGDDKSHIAHLFSSLMFGKSGHKKKFFDNNMERKEDERTNMENDNQVETAASEKDLHTAEEKQIVEEPISAEQNQSVNHVEMVQPASEDDADVQDTEHSHDVTSDGFDSGEDDDDDEIIDDSEMTEPNFEWLAEADKGTDIQDDFAKKKYDETEFDLIPHDDIEMEETVTHVEDDGELLKNSTKETADSFGNEITVDSKSEEMSETEHSEVEDADDEVIDEQEIVAPKDIFNLEVMDFFNRAMDDDDFAMKLSDMYDDDDEDEIIDADMMDDDEFVALMTQDNAAEESDEESEAAEEPEVDEESETVEEPEAAEETEADEESEIAEESEAAEEPEADEESETVEEPEAAEETEADEESETTEELEAEEEPVATEESEAAEEPEVDEESETVEEPEVDEEPEIAEESEADEESETVEEPEADEASEAAEVSEMPEEPIELQDDDDDEDEIIDEAEEEQFNLESIFDLADMARFESSEALIEDDGEDEDDDDEVINEDEDEDEDEILEDYVASDTVMDIFGSVTGVKSIKAQLAKTFTKFEDKALDKMDLLAPYDINFVVTGDDMSVKSQIAIGIAKALNTYGICDKNKLVRATADDLNARDFGIIFEKLKEGCLIIENAGELNERSAQIITDFVNRDNQDVAIVLESDETSLNALFGRYPGIHSKFLNIIHIGKYNEDELVHLAEGYAKNKGYDISELGLKKLKTILRARMEDGSSVNYEDIMAIIEEAISSIEKRNMKNLFNTVLDNKYEEAAMFLLQSEDFDNINIPD